MSRSDDESIALNDFAAAGVTPFSYADGSCGIRGVAGATAFPSAITLAATFDPGLAEEYGAALGEELLAAGHNVLLAPAVDIARDPRSGRIGENLGEDPLLAGELGGRVGRGIQSQGALAVAKHFVGNNVERLRTGEGPLLQRTPALDVEMDERALHEVYLEPFRRAIAGHGVAGLLGSYNRLNGRYTCQSPDLLALPRREWGFEGVTMPDFLFAVRDAGAALEAGLDVPGLDELAGRTPELVAGADDAVIEAIGDHVRSAIARVGLRPATGTVDTARLGAAGALALAERVATDGAILLRNDAALPFARGTRVAVVGTEEVRHRLVVGGAASVKLSDDRIPDLVTALEAAGLEVVATADGAANVPLPALARRDGYEISASIVDAGGRREELLEAAELRADPARPDGEWSAELTIVLPPRAEALVIAADVAGELRLVLDGAELAAGFREASPMVTGPSYVLQAVVPACESPQTLTAHYRTGPAIAIPGTPIAPHLVIGARAFDPLRRAAVAAAQRADAVVMLAGRVTGEAMDAEDLTLPAGQPELIEALVATGTPVVVVTHGAPTVVMPWRERVAAILHVGHPGERFAPALAALLTGGAEPGGRLPMTLAATQPPVAATRPDADARVRYDEGVDVGYRGYERADLTPAYWFGHGLGYADITLLGAEAEGDGVLVDLRCGADRGGKTVVQLYARAASDETLKLVGFAPVHIAAGERRRHRIAVDRAALARRGSGGWMPGSPRVEVHVGLSRGDLRAKVDVTVTSDRDDGRGN